MNLLLVISLTVMPLRPMVSDTPPTPPPADVLMRMQSMADLVANARLADGTRAPADLKLPRALNQRQVVGFILDNYPEPLRESGSPESGYAWLLVNEHGRVSHALIVKSTGRDALDSLALRAVAITRFDPAALESRRTALWMPYPITILPYQKFEELHQQSLTEQPVLTRYTLKPILLNRDEVRLEIGTRYPHEMLKARIGGEVKLWLLLNEAGFVEDVRLKKSSGYPQLDEAGLRVARVMRFKPAEDRGVPVSVWIEIPVVFNRPPVRGRG